MYNIIADLHTHSIASTHAYSTIKEMADSAKEKGLYALAITDHARLMPGAPGDWYFENLFHLPQEYRGIKLIVGIEGNVIDFKGNLDITEEQYSKLDWVVASIHDVPGLDIANPTIEKSTELWLGVANNPRVNVIGHSGSPDFEYDYDVVIPEFGKNHKLVEINSHTFDVRKKNIPYCKKIALACKKYSVPIIVSSDAHFETEIADLGKALKLLEEIDFPEELIVNGNINRLNEYLDKYSRIKENRYK